MDNQDFNSDIDKAVQILRAGGLILYPTDTVWGIGCDACSPEAVSKVYALKRRSDSKALITLVADVPSLQKWLHEVPAGIEKIIDGADRPVTVIFDGARNLAHNLTAADGSIGLRVTREAYSAELCRRLGRPVVSTSANISGQPTARFFGEISPEVISGCDYVARYRRDDTTPSKPSRIIRLFSDGTIKTIRP
jgi:Putative translation factor (SUA5)